jgi:osmotically-inducible protein OsmY
METMERMERMELEEHNGGGSSIELWLAEREDPGLDTQLRREVRDELEWEPGLDPTGIDVQVRDRAVTLRGTVRCYPEKVAALQAAGRVPRVCALIDEIVVDLPSSHVRPDKALLEEAVRVLSWDAQVPREHLRVSVHGGYVAVEGWVEWDHQRIAAEQALRVLTGVRGIENRITVRPKWVTAELHPAITATLRHHRELHTRHVSFETRHGAVRLWGRVPSLAERSAVEHAVWNVPGVTDVVDELTIER